MVLLRRFAWGAFEQGLRSNVFMFLKREDYERLVTQAAQCEFYKSAMELAVKRAEEAESALQGERSGKDWVVTQLASRLVTKSGQYGLDHKLEPPEPPEPSKYTHEPSDLDYAKLEYYKQCYRDAGLPEEKAEQRWEAEMRGMSLPLESEMETEQ